MNVLMIGITVGVAVGLFVLFNWLMGYRKGTITIDFDERYFNHKNYVTAIKKKLQEEGRDVYYEGDRYFIIDGKRYMFIERNITMGGVPLQRTILQLVNKKR